ncbi:acetyltransferase, partial [Pelagibacteraceae bacterium]|nr:acetyltransferase [Pelagibacteraceae bacterium]
ILYIEEKNMDSLVIIGSGGHSKSCLDVIEKEKKYKIVGFVEKNRTKNIKFMGYPILGSDEDLKEIKKKYSNAFIAIGQTLDPKIRTDKFLKLLSLGFKIPVIVSPYSHVSKKTTIGSGTIVMHNVVVNTESHIGKNCIINTKSLIEHEVEIGDNTHVSTGAIINGNCQIGSNTFIGSGSVIKEGLKIGNNCIIGMGSIIKNNIKDNEIAKK